MESVYKSLEDCCGCSTCEKICPAHAVRMIEDSEGFLYPKINQDMCINCNRCVEACAFQKGYEVQENFDQPKVYAMKHKSKEILSESTSGGAFTAFSDAVLNEGGVIYGAGYENQYTVIHKKALSYEERDEFRGSKYVQSDMRNCYLEVEKDLENNGKVLFTGTGCQVAGLKRYLELKGISQEKLVTIDFICHGTPSPKLFREYVEFVEKRSGKKIIKHVFRSKVKGWGHVEENLFEDGSRDCQSVLSQAYRTLFYRDVALRPACHNCRYANMKRVADLTIADYWGIEAVHPEFYSSEGVSAILVNNAKAQDLFEKIKGQIQVIESSLKNCAARQGNLYRPSARSPKRERFWKDYCENGFEYILKKYTEYGWLQRRRRCLINLLRNLGKS